MYILGIDPDEVVDSTGVPAHRLGSLGVDHQGQIFQYCEADGAIDASDAVIIHSDGGAEAITTTLAAAGTGQGKQVGVAPGSNRSQAIAAGDFFWAMRHSIGVGSRDVNVIGATAKYTQLYTSATPGHLDDAFVSAGKVMGLVITTLAGSANQAEVAVCNWPFIASDIDTATGGGG